MHALYEGPTVCFIKLKLQQCRLKHTHRGSPEIVFSLQFLHNLAF